VTVQDLETLLDYSRWANEGLWPVLARLTVEEFTRPVAGGHASIRNTLVHMVSAEWGWLERCGGASRGPALRPRQYPTLAPVVAQCRFVERQMRFFLSAVEDEDLHRVVTFALGGGVTQSMALGNLLHHATIHGVHHRGQVAMLLRLLGYAPGNFDIFLYYAGHQARSTADRSPDRSFGSPQSLAE
jgi:uncharacterized damage-inducible protein DinB